ncbi:type II toxin-antitoxin system RelE/ParE family toxin [Nesterenkonia alba]|uniref:type II toxin-antitoxin system RelE/ParE family toxin n=1 Tax=Nesterenkonia alba TaxID=515814 RepID=UPI001FDFFDB5|nr:type II toxin-antitoxin system RelE/ParE family toxin [Nesterenkonia alba]
MLKSDEYEQWFRKLRDRQAKQKIRRRIDRLAHGYSVDEKSVGGGIFELRVHHGPGYRIYFLREGSLVVLLLWAGDKSSQRRDIRKAQQLAEYWRKS